MRGFIASATSLISFATLAVATACLPDKIYGVNLGSWLVLEHWMLPQEWLEMGGELCDPCQGCKSTEFDFVKAHPETADAIFDKHWTTWFTQGDVDKLVDLGINTVRIPLGYWLVEPLVNRQEEFYPRGGMRHLKEGLGWLKKAGIVAILDHHALPGVGSENQYFAGRCTTDVQFYTPYNYHRALVWTAVMTAFSHLDPDFDNVFAIEAVNEPIQDAGQTPGYGEFQKRFVQVIRAVESSLGVNSIIGPDTNLDIDLSLNFTSSLSTLCKSESMDSEVASALLDSIPVFLRMAHEYADLDLFYAIDPGSRIPLYADFMDIYWQNNNPSNPADAAIGPQVYDSHLYYSFGGVADATEEAYMKSICNYKKVEDDAAVSNSPLFCGEWALPTQFGATDEFLYKWADAQKLACSRGLGWIFWNFKIEQSDLAGNLSRQWSYTRGVELGYLTKDPSQYNDVHVCDPYRE